MSEGALTRHLRALAVEVALHVIKAWAQDHYLHKRIPVLDRRVMEWVDRVFGNFPPFPFKQMQDGCMHPSLIIQGLQDILVSPKSHRRRIFPYVDGTPSYGLGSDAATREVSCPSSSFIPAGSGQRRGKQSHLEGCKTSMRHRKLKSEV